jgi:acetyl esterase/lipase
MRIFIYLIFLLPLLPGCRKKSAGTPGGLHYQRKTFVYKQIPGTDPDLLSLDVYYDPQRTEPKPVVIWVHGGGWCTGDKANRLDNKKRLFASLQYLLVSINYRLSPYPFEPGNPQRIKFPVHNLDVADAIKWVYENIAEYGGDPEKIALLGHSAGAHLVSLTGTNLNFLRQAGVPPRAIKGIASVDTKAYDVFYMVQVKHNDMYINAFGLDSIANKNASPLYRVRDTALYRPAFFIAKRGDAERLGIADAFIDSLRQNGIPVTEIEASNYTHAEINAAIGKEGETIITPPLKRFFKNIFD